MPPTRIPTRADFTPISPTLTVSLTFPDPPESTTSILVLLHGLGDSEAPFASFASNLHLPGVLAIAVRAPHPLPPSLLGLPLDSGPTRHFHWGDDLALSGGALDADPGFETAADLVLEKLVRGVLGATCGWAPRDVLLFGFGQGGALGLGLASMLRGGARVEDVAEAGGGWQQRLRERAFKGVVSIGGALPASMVSTVSAREKSKTPVLLCRGRESEVLDEEAVDFARGEFEEVQLVEWTKTDDGMPTNREEMLPIMKFFADRLRSGW